MTMDLDRIPDTMLAWPLFGAGIENLGVDGKPARWPTPRPAPDQILVRSDAVGSCYSDVKIIRQGGSHPRLYGRDLARRPIVQGHEVAMTVVEVGEAWRDRFRPGQRFALQADFYYRGRNLAYGYVFTGGLAQYSLLGAAALDGDEGCYAIPVPEGLGYAEVALTEPWACVEAAYVPRRRLHVKADGVLWIIGRPGLEGAYRLGATLIGAPPRKIVTTDVPASLLDQITWPEPVRRDGLTPTDYASLAQAETDGGFDDIIVLDPTADVLDGMPAAIATGGVINLVGERPLGRPVQVDVGRVHYDYVVYVGTRGPDIGAAYGPARNRAELRPGGVAWIVGGGGPMGRMHLQRMLEMADGPRKIVVAESNLVRNPELVTSFAPLARRPGDRARRAQPQTNGGRRLRGGAGRSPRRPRFRRHRGDRRQHAGHRGRPAPSGPRRAAGDLRRAGAGHNGRARCVAHLPGRGADHRLGRLHHPRPGNRDAEGRRGEPHDGQRRGCGRRAGRRARRDAGADGRPLPRQDGHLPAGGVLPAHRAG